MEDILGQVVGARSFVGWTYDRFLIFTILSGNDYFKNLPGYALTNVFKAMASASLPASLLAADPHPPLHARPADWFADASLLLYAGPVLDAVAQKQDWSANERYAAGERLLAAYHAIRQHPVSKLRSMGPDALAPASLEVSIMEPLSERERPAGRALEAIIPGVVLEVDAEVATAWARGRLCDVDGELVERRLVTPRDPSDHNEDLDEDWEDDRGDNDPAVAPNGSKVTAATVATVGPAELRAFLGEHGVDFYANTSQRELRRLTLRLIENNVPALDPAHPALHRHTRPNRHLRLLSSNILRGADVYDLAQYLKAGGLSFDQPTRDAWLPFENTRKRGRRLYDSEATFRKGHIRVGSRSHAHSLNITAQPAVYELPGQPAVEAYVFRMPVHASMRGLDHVSMLAVTPTSILLAPNSICGCEVGIECSHLYCLMIVLWKLQQASSWDDFHTTVLRYDKSKAPSGAAVWWCDIYRTGFGGKASPESKSSFDEKVVGATAAPAAPAAAPVYATHISDDPDYHHSSRHVAVLRNLCRHFRCGQVAAMARAEYGDLVGLPDSPQTLETNGGSEGGSERGSDGGSEGGSEAGSAASSIEPRRLSPQMASPTPPLTPLSPLSSPQRLQPSRSQPSGSLNISQGRAKRQEIGSAHRTPASQKSLRF